VHARIALARETESAIDEALAVEALARQFADSLGSPFLVYFLEQFRMTHGRIV